MHKTPWQKASRAVTVRVSLNHGEVLTRALSLPMRGLLMAELEWPLEINLE